MVSPERSAPRKRSLEVCAPPHPQQNGNSAQIAAAAVFLAGYALYAGGLREKRDFSSSFCVR